LTKLFYQFGPFRLDAEKRVLLREGEVVPLKPKAFDTLFVLVQNHGQVLEKDDLMERLWPDSEVEESNLPQHISALRKAFGESPNERLYIVTVPGRGYRFAAEVVEFVEEDPSPPVETYSLSTIFHEKEDSAADTSRALPARRFFAVRRKPVLASLAILAVTSLLASGLWLGFRKKPVNLPSQPLAALPPMNVVPLTSLTGTKMGGSFSPDGSQFAFGWFRNLPPEAEIYVKLVSEGEPERLTHSGKFNFSPVWSPNSQRIAFVRRSESETAIFTISAYGKDERRLISFAQGRERRISWSPDGKYIAFADTDKDQPSRGRAIFLVSPDTLEIRALTSPPENYSDEGPAFSPDSKTISFVRGCINNSSIGAGNDLYVVPVSGGEPTPLTFEDKLWWLGPTWTEDGSEIIFSSYRLGSLDLYRIPALGGSPQPLGVGGDDSVTPTVSLRGNRLAYINFPFNMNIYRVVLPEAKNSGNASAPFLISTRVNRGAQLSPDDKKIAFQSDRSASGEEIWVCDMDGSNCTPVTSFATYTETPRWSPDGKHIVCKTIKDCKTGIYTIDIETRRVHSLIPNPCEEIKPSWSQDGQWVYFGSRYSGSWQIWKVLAEGGEPVQLTQRGGFLPLESADGKFVYYEKGGEGAGIWRVPKDGGEEILIVAQLQPGMSENWAVVADGIYFIRYNLHSKEEGAILFYDFAKGRLKEIVKLGKHQIVGGGLAVASDRRSFFFTVWEHQAGAEIKIVENFR
jgi:Tol biopolymer transport system component/DNA-binding winged helix-turn-helix (wHTH) protein